MLVGRAGSAVSLLALAALGACAPRPAPPPPTPPPPPAPSPAPPPPLPPPADWREAPLTAGDWSFAETRASYGSFSLRCDDGRIALALNGGAGASALLVRTTYGERRLPATGGVAMVAASDPLLDQIAFSRGRFLVQADGLPALILPAWPEPARVIEDCRG